MKIIDLTHTIKNDMPVYPGTEQPQLTTACTIEESGYRETLMHMYSHTGTHMDAPAHMMAEGMTLDAFDANRLVGRAIVVDCRGESAITLEKLRSYPLQEAEFVLFCTGWDRYWGHAEYYEGFPVLTADAAAYLSTLPLKGVGEDSISLDPCDSADFPNHLTLMHSGFLNTENLKHLDELIGKSFIFATLPLKFENSDGCSCRAVAMVDD